MPNNDSDQAIPALHADAPQRAPTQRAEKTPARPPIPAAVDSPPSPHSASPPKGAQRGWSHMRLSGVAGGVVSGRPNPMSRADSDVSTQL